MAIKKDLARVGVVTCKANVSVIRHDNGLVSTAAGDTGERIQTLIVTRNETNDVMTERSNQLVGVTRSLVILCGRHERMRCEMLVVASKD
jgi:hypothetical protein